MHLGRYVAAFWPLIALVLQIAAPVHAAAHIQIQNQTGTSLTMKFVDASDDEFTLSFTRENTNENWNAVSTASPSMLFGNPEPRYAGAALRRALGITIDQAITTFNPSTIVNRPMEDVTIFKTFSGLAIALWQQRAITEIHYVGTWVEVMQAMTAEAEGDMSMCEASVAECCNGAGAGNWPPDLDSCNASLQCGGAFKDSACTCLDTACNHCPHPAPAPPLEDPCSPGDREISTGACNMGGPACEVEPPPDPPIGLQDIWELLRRMLDLLEEWLNNQVWN